MFVANVMQTRGVDARWETLPTTGPARVASLKLPAGRQAASDPLEVEQVLTLLDGRVHADVHGERVELSRGSVLVLPPGTASTLTASEEEAAQLVCVRGLAHDRSGDATPHGPSAGETTAEPPPVYDDSWVTRFNITDPAEREEGFRHSAAALATGQLVVIPTDTVYGVAADASQPSAVDALLRAKGCEPTTSVPVLIGARSDLTRLASVSDSTYALVERFWPGPLTLVCRAAHQQDHPPASAAPTISVRMPDNATTLRLLETVGPLAVSSASRSGLPPASSADEAIALLAESVAVYLDAGVVSSAQRSTILDVSSQPPRLLRPGVVSEHALRDVLPGLVSL